MTTKVVHFGILQLQFSFLHLKINLSSLQFSEIITRIKIKTTQPAHEKHHTLQIQNHTTST